ncbi:MAG: NAD-dependent epimerase/dehydratase family protein [Desulfomonilia bacterium]
MTKKIKKVLITGVAGFIGRFVAKYFAEQGWITIGIDSIPYENAPVMYLSSYKQLHLPDEALHTILHEHSPEACINCAGRSSVPWSFPNPAIDFASNTVLPYYILDACRLHSPATKCINISSAAVYGNPEILPVCEDAKSAPISPYGFHKLQSELIYREFHHIYGLPTASVRIFSAYGPGLRRQVLWDICQKALSSASIVLQGTGRESRDFIHAYDIARAFMILTKLAPMQGEIYNLASGQETTISELSSILLGALNYKCRIIFDGQVPAGVPSNWKADISKISALGFKPSIPFKQGAEAFAAWCRSELLLP